MGTTKTKESAFLQQKITLLFQCHITGFRSFKAYMSIKITEDWTSCTRSDINIL